MKRATCVCGLLAIWKKFGRSSTSQPLPPQAADSQPLEITLAVPNQTATDRLVDQLRTAGVSIYELEISRRTLEDAFLALVSTAIRSVPAAHRSASR